MMTDDNGHDQELHTLEQDLQMGQRRRGPPNGSQSARGARPARDLGGNLI